MTDHLTGRECTQGDAEESRGALPPARLHQGSLFAEPSFRELCAHFEEMYLSKRGKKGTRDSRRSYIAQAQAWLSQRGLTHPEAADWVAYQNWRLSPSCPNFISAPTWNTHRKLLSGVYEFCIRLPKRGWGAVPNPIHHTQVRPVPERRKMPRCMAQPHVTFPLLLQAMPDVRWKAFVSLLFWLGPRVQEALAIPLPGSKRDDRRNLLDLDKGVLTIAMQRDTELSDWEDLKTGFSYRTLALPPEPLELIRATLQWKRHNDLNPTREWKRRRGFAMDNFLFPFWRDGLEAVMDLHRQVAPGDFTEWERGERGAGAYHVYRHTMATAFMREAEAQGLSYDSAKRDVHEILGHADMRTTDAYLVALRLNAVKSSGMSQIWAGQKARIEQAVSERNGRGLKLVTARETGR